ncbi:helix-turn-helix transcriptional regulator [Paraburkholderia sp. J67]|uniref:helix-turn-helix transcriptional regulator n=1 Tax=Paraburkholderia sp. J67 TaxID=2805435 RepID=UPI002ABE015E|nr:AlpA family phage regulatory protein [Paraburkholderia sp. J67]
MEGNAVSAAFNAQVSRIKRAPDAAVYIGVSLSTLRRLSKAPHGPKPIKLGGASVGFDVRDLDEWIDRKKAACGQPEASS